MRLTKTLLLGVYPLALVIAPVLAQSTGSEQVETVVVTGLRADLASGMGSATLAPKQTSVITQDFIETQPAGQTFFESLNILPGFNFENRDAYGTSGGDISMHGQAGDHISVTIDGLPLNDTGNYAMYSGEMVDPELIDRVTVNQGTTDVDSPTAAVTGGTIALRTVRPDTDFTVRGAVSYGSEAFNRVFGRIDSGEFGPWGTRAFFTGSYSNYDKFRGYGDLEKKQFNAAIYQSMGNIGWMMLAAHWDVNRNNSYWGDYFTGGKGATINWDNFYSNTSDYGKTCDSSDKTFNGTGCSSWYKTGINPSDSGNIRFSSLWHLSPNLTLTVDSSLQFILANGGGTTSVKETDPRLIGSSSGGSTVTYSNGEMCITGKGCDLNGDGVVSSSTSVRLASPSNTNTRRWGFNANLIYNLDANNMFRWAYTLDFGFHRQTGQMAFLSADRGYYSVWGGLDDSAHRVETADGSDLRKRDRNSHAILNQMAFEYVGNYFSDAVGANIGFRLPYFERELNNHCYEEIGYSAPMCTNATPTAIASNGIVTFAGSSYKFVETGKETVYYSKFLPHAGLSYKPFGDEHFFFVNYTQELAAPKTDNLYTATGSLYGATASTYYTGFESIKPETSTSYTIGYRYLGERINGSLVLYDNQVRNRIVSSYDQDTQASTYRNVSGINFSGVDLDVNYHVLDNLLVYGSASYTSARIAENIPVTASVFAQTKDKQLSNTPKWTFAGRIQYKPLPELKIGVDAKYVGSRYATDDDNVAVPDYVRVDADLTYSLDRLGWSDMSLKLNVKNLLDEKYISGIYTYSCYTGTSGCSSQPYMYAGAPRTVMVSLSAKY